MEKVEKSDKEEKAEIINAFTKLIDKHCASGTDVWFVIRAIRDCFQFMADKRYKYRTDLFALQIRSIKNSLKNDKDIDFFNDVFEDLLECILTSGENAEGLIIMDSSEMRNELSTFLSEHAC